MRFTLTIPDAMGEELKRRSEITGISTAEIIRRAITEHFSRPQAYVGVETGIHHESYFSSMLGLDGREGKPVTVSNGWTFSGGRGTVTPADGGATLQHPYRTVDGTISEAEKKRVADNTHFHPVPKKESKK